MNTRRQQIKTRGPCKWKCPICGKRCGGLTDHESVHQCPVHYKSQGPTTERKSPATSAKAGEKTYKTIEFNNICDVCKKPVLPQLCGYWFFIKNGGCCGEPVAMHSACVTKEDLVKEADQRGFDRCMREQVEMAKKGVKLNVAYKEPQHYITYNIVWNEAEIRTQERERCVEKTKRIFAEEFAHVQHYKELALSKEVLFARLDELSKD